MTDRDEAVEAVTRSLQHAWTEWCDDTGHFPECFTWRGGNGSLWADFRRGNFVAHVVDALAAAGYTVTKDRYEPRWFFQPCPNGCGCVLPDDPDRHDCACDGPCCTDAWPLVVDVDEGDPFDRAVHLYRRVTQEDDRG